MARSKARPLAKVVADLLTLDPADFESSCQYDKLEPLVDEVAALCSADEAARILLGVAEKMDGWDLRSPGPLVHTLEDLPGCERHLMASVQRHPTPYTVWMANRVLNSLDTASAQRPWLKLLRSVAKHPRASEETRERAADFLRDQAGEK